MSFLTRSPVNQPIVIGTAVLLGAAPAAAIAGEDNSQHLRCSAEHTHRDAGCVAAPALIAAAPSLDIRAAVMSRFDARTWKGKVLSPQLGRGRLTLTGVVEFLDHEDAHPRAHVLRFDVAFAKGHLRGCVRNSMYLRPGNRQVWDGYGHITSTSRALDRYRGLEVGDGGATPTSDLTVAKPFSLRSGVRTRGDC